MKTFTLSVLSGDGIGPEVMEEAIRILKHIESLSGINFVLNSALIGGIAIDQAGHALPAQTLEICQKSDAILFGSIGGPKWESLPASQQPERAALLPLRKHFELFANLRPAKIYPELAQASPIKNEIVSQGVDILIIRELTGGLYFGKPKELNDDRALDTMVYTRPEIERITHIAFQAAQKRSKKLCSVDKANVLSSSVLWRKIVNEIHAQYPDIELQHMYVDNAAMQLIKIPYQFDVLLCENMFGDILSDEASMITGSIGMLPSASLNASSFGLYEPSGGSAPDIAGRGIANPIAQILSLALLLRYSLGLDLWALKIEKAVEETLKDGYRTQDIYSAGFELLNTSQMGKAVLERIKN